jgi:hypothetical protein
VNTELKSMFNGGEEEGVAPAIVTSGFIFGVKLWEKGGGAWLPDPRPMKGFSGG